MFAGAGYGPPMPNEPLTPADPDAVRQLLAFALSFDGRKHFKTSGEMMMARVTAEHLVRHLEMSGFVVMKRRPRQGRSTSGFGKLSAAARNRT